MKKSLVIHPFLFAIFPILFLFSHNIGKVLFSETFLPLAIVLSFTILAVLLLGLILRDEEKVGIIVSAFLILFFSYGHIYELVRGWQVGNFIPIIKKQEYLLFTLGMLFACGTCFIIKTRRNLHNFTNILNVMTLSLIIISLINIGSYKLKTRISLSDIKSTENIETITDIDIEASPMRTDIADVSRDIYYIILDRYGREDTLKEIYNFDNSEFIDYLSNRGFYVASESKANYLTTEHSLASSLNMKYINYLAEKVGEESNDWHPICEMMEDNQVWRFLKSKGYKFIYFGSWYEPTRKNKFTDMNFNFYSLPEFMEVLYKTTMFYPLDLKLHITDFGDYRLQQWRRVMWKFDKLSEMPNIKEPTFVFVHMLIPHEPFVFDRNGAFISTQFWLRKDKKSEIELGKRYVDQLIFLNKKLKNLIDELLSASDVSPIIILQADEGPWPFRYRFDEFNFNWRDQATEVELREKMRILNAYYLPNIDKNILYPSITPVNSFRLIFNIYFNTHFELLPDENYANVDKKHIYKFFNVTEQVK